MDVQAFDSQDSPRGGFIPLEELGVSLEEFKTWPVARASGPMTVQVFNGQGEVQSEHEVGSREPWPHPIELRIDRCLRERGSNRAAE